MAITLKEAASAASCFPLVFAPGLHGRTLKALLRRSSTGAPVFVGADGRWQAAWLPPRLAAWPFDLIAASGGRHALAVYEDSGFILQGAGGHAIFREDGAGDKDYGLTPETARLATLLRAHAEDLPATTAAVAALDQLGLLIPLDAEQDLKIVAAEAATSLTEESVLTLHRVGALALLHAGLVSLAHLGWMARAEHRSPQAELAPAQDRPAGLAGSGFLGALAAAAAPDQIALPFPLDPLCD